MAGKVSRLHICQQLFILNQEKSWTSTDPKLTIDYKPNDNSMVWYTFATGFKGGGWQFATYFKELVEQGFDPEELEMNVTGRNLAEGIPETFSLKSSQVYEAMKDPLSGIIRAIRNALELSPPELAADIAERGIVLTGGGALMRDLDKLISSSTGIPVICAEDPLTCVARGGGKALEIIDKYNIDLLSTE